MVRYNAWRVVLSGVLLGAAFAPASAQPPPAAASRTQGAAVNVSAAIDKIFEPWDRAATPGCAVGVSERGQVTFTKGYGMANLEYGIRIWPSTVFESGSVAKQFTAAAIALLAQDGKLSIDDPVRKYVPELPDFGAPILIRHLLNHTSGLRCQWPMLALAGRPLGVAVHTMAEILELYSDSRDLNFKPGEEFLYSSTAYVLLGVIVERVSGKSVGQFSQERLFGPLGMTRTQWRTDFAAIVPNRASAYRLTPDGQFRAYMPLSSVIGNAGLLTTVSDLLIWNDNLDHPRVGGKAMVEQLQTRGRLNGGFETEYAQGLYVFDYRGAREISHGGTTAGYEAFLARFPDHGLSVAVLCNATGTNPGQYAHDIADILLGEKLKDRPVLRVVAVEPGVLENMAGVYRETSTDAVLRLTWEPKVRELRANGQPLVPFGAGLLSTRDGSRRFSTQAGWPEHGPAAYLTETTERQTPRAWNLQRPYTPSAAQLADFAGDYLSPELGVTYTFYVEDGVLKLRFRPAQRFTMEPVFKDGFLREGDTIRFTRSAAGAVDGLSIYAGRARHVRFVRQ